MYCIYSILRLGFMSFRQGMCQAAVGPEVQIGKRYCNGFPQLLFDRSFCV